MLDLNRLLNISSKDRSEEIKSIVTSEVEKINSAGTVDGVCKLVANNIKCCLNDASIKNYTIDLNTTGIDHVSLVAEYYGDELRRILIDPTISQFSITETSYLKNKDLIDKLVKDGLAVIDDQSFSEYLSIFSGKTENINLDEYLRNIRINKR